MSHDIRWIQRFENFKKALGQLKEAVLRYLVQKMQKKKLLNWVLLFVIYE